MKIIIENNSTLSDRYILKQVLSSYNEILIDFMKYGNNTIRKRDITHLTENGDLIKFQMWVNRIKTGLTFKFYDL